MKISLKSLVFFGGVLLAISVLFAIPESIKPKLKEVIVFDVKSLPLFESVIYIGRVESKINAQLLSEYEGVVAKISSRLGQQVKKGAGLLVIRQTDPVYDFAPLLIRSPVAGIVSEIAVSEGSRIMKGQKLATVTDPSRIWLRAEVPGLDLKELRVGMEGEFRSPETSGGVRITGLSPMVDSTTGTATVSLETEGKLALAPGSIGKIAFKIHQRQGILLPEDALVYRDKATFVIVVVGGKAKRIPVTLGSFQNGQVEIVSGLKPGDAVVHRSSGFIGDGESVSVNRPS